MDFCSIVIFRCYGLLKYILLFCYKKSLKQMASELGKYRTDKKMTRNSDAVCVYKCNLFYIPDRETRMIFFFKLWLIYVVQPSNFQTTVGEIYQTTVGEIYHIWITLAYIICTLQFDSVLILVNPHSYT